MNYDGFFLDAIARLRDERRYRVFAQLERVAGRFPRAIWHSPEGSPKGGVTSSSGAPTIISAWRHPKVIGAMVETTTRMGTGAGGTRNISGTNHPLVQLEAELADLHDKDAALVILVEGLGHTKGKSISPPTTRPTSCHKRQRVSYPAGRT